MQDLLSIGEAFAELDLAVRQQQDGSLTLAVDDALPDSERVRVAAGEHGVEGSLRVARAPELTRELTKALDRLNGEPASVRFVWRDGEVLACAHLPWGDRSLAGNQLRVFYGALAEAEGRYGNAFRAALRGSGSWGSLYDSAEMLPPSYLAGPGQMGDDAGLTRRYGGLEQVPGRGELSPTERYHPRPRAGGGGRLVAGLLLVALAGGGAAWFQARERSASPSPAPPPAPTTAPQERVSPADAAPADDIPDDAIPDDDTHTDDTPALDPDAGNPAGGEETPASALDADGILRAVRSQPARRAELVRRWVARGFDRPEGARRRMLEALGTGELDPDVGRELLQSLREHPLDPYEAMDCFDLTQAGLRRELLEALSRAQGDAAADAAAFLKQRRGAGDDVLVETALLELGAGEADSFLAVVAARGIDWVTFGRGQALLERMARRDLLALRPLLGAQDEALRIQVLTVIRGVDGQDETALRLFAGCLQDPAPAVRQQAVQGCVDLADPKASWALARALVREADGQTLDALRGAFTRLPSDPTVELLGQLYRKPAPEDRLAALRGLEATQTAAGVGVLHRALRDPALEVRRAALEGLEGLHKRNPDLRPAVAEGLGAIRELALSGDDAELTRLAKNLHYRISGSMPR